MNPEFIYTLTIPQFKKMLNNLSGFLDKGAQFAETKKIEVEVLLNSRLAPDQFNFIRQVQIACDTAKLGVARLIGKEAPVHNDTEKTVAELKARIASTISFLDTVKAQDFQGSHERKIAHPRWNGEYLYGEEFLVQHMVPNVYFHVMTAYSILRHNGVELGKKDYLNPMPFKK